MPRVIVGMSGGVDSAVAAYLLKCEGYDVIGVTLRTWESADGGESRCCEIDDARETARFIGIPYHVFNCIFDFEEKVVKPFVDDYISGMTPNPCVVCNRRLKFGLLPEMAARQMGFDRFATGHYARRVEVGGRFAVARAADESKDQSYFLWGLSQEQLGRAVFPLGGLSKAEVRRIAHDAGLPMADKPDSQDFYSGDANEIVGKKDAEGRIVSADGRTLGMHHGFWRYTVGQRQGLGIGGGAPYYVVRLDACRNEVVVGRREEAVCREFAMRDLNWQGAEPTDGPVEGFVKIRSSGSPAGPVTLEHGIMHAPDGLFGVAPGQSAVLYSAVGTILCGGTIAQGGEVGTP